MSVALLPLSSPEGGGVEGPRGGVGAVVAGLPGGRGRAGADLAALRDLVRAIEGRAAPSGRGAARRLTTGFEALDRLLPFRGYPPGEVTQIVSGVGEGGLSLVVPALAAVTARGRLAAVVDAEGTLYPPALAARGVVLDRLLVVRPPPAAERSADWAVLELARALPLVVASAVPADAVAVRRWRAAAEAGEGAVLLLGRPGAAPDLPAALRLAVRPLPARSARHRPARVIVERLRGVAPGTAATVDLEGESEGKGGGP